VRAEKDLTLNVSRVGVYVNVGVAGIDVDSVADSDFGFLRSAQAKMKAAQRIQNADGSIEERVVEEILTRRKSKNT
jgi:hypothetical protein